jgi:spermidine synthase
LLGVGLAGAAILGWLRSALGVYLDVGGKSSPQFVYFGTEFDGNDPSLHAIPIEVVAGFFFLVLALAMVGPGQQLGRALRRLPNRIQAYSINILGSMAGIVLFGAFAWLHLAPIWWFLAIAGGIAYFLALRPRSEGGRASWVTLATLVPVVLLSLPTSLPELRDGQVVAENLWSPYYWINYESAPKRAVCVNRISHQTMISREAPFPAYALPYLLNRDAGGKPFKDVLIIGAGSGNDVSRALQWGAEHIDAVDIDPVILDLGRREHPDRPYQDLRVTVHLDDGRNFLRASEKQYDLIVFALIDSLVLHSSYSNIRLESYLFTAQAFDDVANHLKPGGRFFLSNYFRQGWIVTRLKQGLEGAFHSEPLVLTLPYREVIQAEEKADGFTLFIAGRTEDTARLRIAFEKQPHYWLETTQPPSPQSPNGFVTPNADERARLRSAAPQENGPTWHEFGLATVEPPSEPLRAATDDWPFLYLRAPMIPDLSLRGAGLMAGLAMLLLLVFLPRPQGQGSRWGFDARMFFLGAGFMLIETKAVVHMALLFGSTWMVNSVVFFAVLGMILAANLLVLTRRPRSLTPYYLGLLITLGLNVIVPLDFFLGMSRVLQITGSCLLVFAPILFAGMIFAVSFERSTEPDRAFAANIAGAMAGGLAEYSSMLVGFQYIVVVALAFYALSYLCQWTNRRSPAGSRTLAAPDQEPGVPLAPATAGASAV